MPRKKKLPAPFDELIPEEIPLCRRAVEEVFRWWHSTQGTACCWVTNDLIRRHTADSAIPFGMFEYRLDYSCKTLGWALRRLEAFIPLNEASVLLRVGVGPTTGRYLKDWGVTTAELLSRERVTADDRMRLWVSDWQQYIEEERRRSPDFELNSIWWWQELILPTMHHVEAMTNHLYDLRQAIAGTSRSRAAGRRKQNEDLLRFAEEHPELQCKEVIRRFREIRPKHSIFESDNPKGALRAAQYRARQDTDKQE
jgi:hypothetical protein